MHLLVQKNFFACSHGAIEWEAKHAIITLGHVWAKTVTCNEFVTEKKKREREKKKKKRSEFEKETVLQKRRKKKP